MLIQINREDIKFLCCNFMRISTKSSFYFYLKKYVFILFLFNCFKVIDLHPVNAYRVPQLSIPSKLLGSEKVKWRIFNQSVKNLFLSCKKNTCMYIVWSISQKKYCDHILAILITNKKNMN